jgi:HSP20 family protein
MTSNQSQLIYPFLEMSNKFQSFEETISDTVLPDGEGEEELIGDEQGDDGNKLTVSFPRNPSFQQLYDRASEIQTESFYRDDTTSIYDEFPTHMDTRETPYHYIVNLVVPGLTVEDMHVECVHGILMITGEVKKEAIQKGLILHKTERKYGKFGRSVKLPKNIYPNAIKASLQQGILTVIIEKELQ